MRVVILAALLAAGCAVHVVPNAPALTDLTGGAVGFGVFATADGACSVRTRTLAGTLWEFQGSTAFCREVAASDMARKAAAIQAPVVPKDPPNTGGPPVTVIPPPKK